MAVAGDDIYMSGNFSTMGGKPRNRVAIFNTTTNALVDWGIWDPSFLFSTAIAGDGDRVYVGGTGELGVFSRH